MKKIVLTTLSSILIITGCAQQSVDQNYKPAVLDKKEFSSPNKPDLINNFNDNNFKISYPKDWGKAATDTNIAAEWITFSNLPFIYDSGSTSKDTILYKNSKFSLGIIDYNDTIINWNDNFTGGGEAVPYNLEYFDYMKNKFSSFNQNCDETIFGGGHCFDLQKITMGNTEYLSYYELGFFGDMQLEKTWIRFFDDKMIIISLDFEKPWLLQRNPVNIKSENPKLEDFNIDKDKLSQDEKKIEEFLSTINFQSTIYENQINQNLQNFERYKEELKKSKELTNTQELSELSKSNFIQVRANVGSNNKTSIDTLKTLANDPNDLVKVYVKFNPNTPKDISDKIVNPF